MKAAVLVCLLLVGLAVAQRRTRPTRPTRTNPQGRTRPVTVVSRRPHTNNGRPSRHASRPTPASQLPRTRTTGSRTHPTRFSRPPHTGSRPTKRTPPHPTGSHPTRFSHPQHTRTRPTGFSRPPHTGSRPTMRTRPQPTGSHPTRFSHPPNTGSHPPIRTKSQTTESHPTATGQHTALTPVTSQMMTTRAAPVITTVGLSKTIVYLTWSGSSDAVEQVSKSPTAFRKALITAITGKYSMKPEQLQDIRITTDQVSIYVQFHIAGDKAKDVVQQIKHDVTSQDLKVSVATVGNAQYQYSATKASSNDATSNSSGSGLSTSTVAIIAALASAVVIIAVLLMVIMKITKNKSGRTSFQMLDNDSMGLENPTYDASAGSVNFK